MESNTWTGLKYSQLLPCFSITAIFSDCWSVDCASGLADSTFKKLATCTGIETDLKSWNRFGSDSWWRWHMWHSLMEAISESAGKSNWICKNICIVRAHVTAWGSGHLQCINIALQTQQCKASFAALAQKQMIKWETSVGHGSSETFVLEYQLLIV